MYTDLRWSCAGHLATGGSRAGAAPCCSLPAVACQGVAAPSDPQFTMALGTGSGRRPASPTRLAAICVHRWRNMPSNGAHRTALGYHEAVAVACAGDTVPLGETAVAVRRASVFTANCTSMDHKVTKTRNDFPQAAQHEQGTTTLRGARCRALRRTWGAAVSNQ